MSNNKQSSVEWLVEQIKKDINLRLRGFDIDKALKWICLFILIICLMV